MPEEVDLERQLKKAAKTGKYVVGRREVMSGVKGTKLLVWSASANVPQKILDECKALSVPAVRFDGNPVELGKACGIPFRVSVIAVKSSGDADIRAYSNSTDYVSSSFVGPTVKEEKVEEAEEEPKVEEKAPQKRRKKSGKLEVAKKETETKSAKPKKTTRKKIAVKEE